MASHRLPPEEHIHKENGTYQIPPSERGRQRSGGRRFIEGLNHDQNPGVNHWFCKISEEERSLQSSPANGIVREGVR